MNAPAPILTPALTASPQAPALKDLLQEGIYLLFLLRNGNLPAQATELARRVDDFLSSFEQHARNFGKPPEAIEGAKYAFCALLDETILSCNGAIREDWERAPLQLRVFGEHLAGEGFFDRLEMLRLDPDRNLETLEVFYTCLILGFQGKYLLEGSERLNYLISRIGQEIAQARGGKAAFAPHWKLPFRFQEFVRHELPLGLFFGLVAVIAVGIFVTYSYLLNKQAEAVTVVPVSFTEPAKSAAQSLFPGSKTPHVAIFQQPFSPIRSRSFIRRCAPSQHRSRAGFGTGFAAL